MRRFVQTFMVAAALAVPAAAHAAVAQHVSAATGTVQSTPVFMHSELAIDATSSEPVAVAARDLCEGHRSPAVMCGPGNGRRTRGGGNKVSHLGWPAVTGILWIVRPEANSGQTDNGTELNDELLGLHGNDTLRGGFGNNIRGGSGNDHIWGHFGHGTIDCGSGWDVVHTKHHSTYKLRNCERHLDH